MRAPTTNLANILANTSLFKMLDEAQLAKLAARTTVLRMSANSAVVDEGDVAEGTYWVVYGQVKIGLHSKEGSARVLAILGSAKCFGLGEMMHEQPHLAFVKTTTDTMLLHVEREAMLEAAEENFEFAREIMQCMGRQYYTLMRDIGDNTQSARQRLAGYLLRHAQPDPEAPVELVASKAVIASRLNVTPETMSRLLREFTFEGLIQVAGRRISVLDWQRMAAVVA
jgi:CRP-like cAMP-binding protein